MSRRKQEKPQPRKNLVQGEEVVQDILTCGACQRDFPLREIVRFIQHKVNACGTRGKDGCFGNFFGEPPDDSNDSNEELLYSLLRNNKKLLDSTDEDNNKTFNFSTLKNALAKSKAATRPSIFICSTCKQSHASAWLLLQHVQNQHGLKIYVDSGSSSPNSKANNDCITSSEQSPPKERRVPLLEHEVEPASLFPRLASQELRIDLLGLSSTNSHLSSAQLSPPPLIEVSQLDTSTKSTYEPQLDFYSQRLKELAGATSPNSSPAKNGKSTSAKSEVTTSNGDKNTSTNSHMPPQSSPPSSTTSENSPVSPVSKKKSCEFCGKSFRFMSNLIVHRRSHTGEKPFKCHICNHACTQASKLNRHMKTHRRRSKSSSKDNSKVLWPLEKNGVQDVDAPVKLNNHDSSQMNGQADYASDDQGADSPKSTANNVDCDEDDDVDIEDDDEMDDDDEDDEADRENGSNDNENAMAEDLSKKTLKNGTTGNGVAREDRKVRHSLLSEVMKEIGLASIQQYSKAYKQALKESSALKHERHSDGSASNDGANNLDRPSREGTRSAGQSPLSFSTGLLSAFDQTMGIKRIKLEDNWQDKEDNNTLYSGMLIPSMSVHSMSSYKDLYSADGSDRRKSKNESALMSTNSLSGLHPGPSTSLSNLNSIANNLLKPKEQRRNDTCEYCGKIFKNCSNLTVHRRSHTGEKPYKCELCSYACAQSSKLTRHMKTHGRMGKDVYRCRFCDMPFSVPSTLEKHMRKCVVSQSGGSSYLLSERESDSKDMSSQFALCVQGDDKEH